MIDSGIYSQIQAPKENNLLGQYAQMQQIQGAQAQNRLADLMYGEKQRDAASSRAMDDAYRGAIGPDGVIDRQKLYSSIAQTSGRQLPAVQKGFAETDKAEIESKKNAIALQRDKLAFAGQILGSVTDQSTYDKARQTATSNGLDVSNMPAQYDPGFVAGKLKEAMTVKEQLEQKWKQMEYTTPNANTVATNENRVLTTGMTNDVSRRGQDKASETAALGRKQAEQHFQANQSAPQYMETDAGLMALPKKLAPGQVPTGIPVAGADGQALGKPLRQIPASVNTAIIQNSQSTGQIDRALKLLEGTDVNGMVGDKDATGYKGYLPNNLLNRIDSKGVDARAAISDIGSLIIHDRSGAAVTVSEAPRLMPFIPLATDDHKTVVKKLNMLRVKLGNESSAMQDVYSKEQGYRPSPVKAEAAPSGGPKPGAVQDGYRFKGGNPADSKSWEKM